MKIHNPNQRNVKRGACSLLVGRDFSLGRDFVAWAVCWKKCARVQVVHESDWLLRMVGRGWGRAPWEAAFCLQQPWFLLPPCVIQMLLFYVCHRVKKGGRCCLKLPSKGAGLVDLSACFRSPLHRGWDGQKRRRCLRTIIKNEGYKSLKWCLSQWKRWSKLSGSSHRDKINQTPHFPADPWHSMTESWERLHRLTPLIFQVRKDTGRPLTCSRDTVVSW